MSGPLDRREPAAFPAAEATSNGLDAAGSGELPEPRWGLGEPAWGFVLAQVCGLVLGSALITLAGQSPETATPESLPGWALILQAPPLWIGFLAAPIWAARHRGNGVRRDFALAVAWRDVAPWAAAGVVLQLVVVPLVSWPFIWLSGASTDALSESARTLASKADSPAMVALLVLTAVIGAPIVEELFFRGLLLGAIAKRWSVAVGVVGSSVIFGASHFQPLQFPALATAGLVFALARVWTGRLGPAIVCHLAFNATTVVMLVGFS